MLEYFINIHIMTIAIGATIYTTNYLEDKHLDNKDYCYYPDYLAEGVIEGLLFPTKFTTSLIGNIMFRFI